MLIGAITAVLWAGTAATAHAGLLTLYHYGEPGVRVWGGQYTALPGEQNRLHVTFNPTTQWLTITDYGALVILPFVDGGAALGNCSFQGNTVKCRRLGHTFQGMFFGLGDGNDRIALIGPVPASVGGDDGNDVLDARSSTLGVTLAGGAGNDTLRGGPGADEIFGGRGADDLSGGDGDEDRLVHRYDALRWYSTGWASDDATAGVNISLDDVSNDGQAGEGDNVWHDVERVRGGSGNDKISGHNGAQSFYGNGGNDTLYGSGGNDALFGGLGNDRIYAGSGNDYVEGNAGNDTMYGEGGTDKLLGHDGNDYFYVRDGAADNVDGGNGYDRAQRDAIDSVLAIEAFIA
jgi:hypothetical protein